MKMRFLAPPISLAALLLGLSYMDSAADEFVIRAPAQAVEEIRIETREIAMDASPLPKESVQVAL